jgi:hypothetical protein
MMYFLLGKTITDVMKATSVTLVYGGEGGEENDINPWLLIDGISSMKHAYKNVHTYLDYTPSR